MYNVGPTSSTLVRHCTNVIQMFFVLLGEGDTIFIMSIIWCFSLLINGWLIWLDTGSITFRSPKLCQHLTKKLCYSSHGDKKSDSALLYHTNRTVFLRAKVVRGRSLLYEPASQQTRGIHPILFQCWHTVFDAGPTLKQHWVNVPCLLASVPAKL